MSERYIPLHTTVMVVMVAMICIDNDFHDAMASRRIGCCVAKQRYPPFELLSARLGTS